eukprot:CAMPEP_0114520774 /NCGR_PEP_ID=MMETSP0109-20121206/19804_1 /TAXON_ID=29199 /ORGANISM="Chlorarachnion reptans, Strain CCCM449" /LENGTH=892 /DNA_ID=CAMNT_0001701779 /DNA_START=24 /DNA_END=2703 /DNA_ORIENTATION=-
MAPSAGPSWSNAVLPLALAVTVPLASAFDGDHICFCPQRRSSDWEPASAIIECIYRNDPADDGCRSRLRLNDVPKKDKDGWTFLHHAAAAGNTQAAQALFDLLPSTYYPMNMARVSGKFEQTPQYLKDNKDLRGLSNVWGWQPVHVAAASNQGSFIKFLTDLPVGLNAMILRYRLAAEDRYNRTAFVVAIDSGSVDAAAALTSHPFAAQDVESMVMFHFNIFARAKLAGEEMYKWYREFVEKRRKQVAHHITHFYKPWPLPEVLRTKGGRTSLNASQLSAWPPVFRLPKFASEEVCRTVIRDSKPLCSRKNTFGPQNMFAGVPRAEIPAVMEGHDENHDGILDARESDAFIRTIMNRETGGVKELLGFKMPTRRIARALALDKNGDGRINYATDEKFTEADWPTYNRAILKEARLLESRVIRTQQSARLSTKVTFDFSKYAIEKLGIPNWLDVQFQVIHSVPPGEHYGHHDDGAFRIFTVFLYCEVASKGGATAFPFAISMHNGTEWTEQDSINYANYRSMGTGDEYHHHVHLHEMCEVHRDCCDPDCHAMHRGPLPWKFKCEDDDLSLRANAISGGLLRKLKLLGDGTCGEAARLGLCKHKRFGWDMRMICPKSCKSCKQARKHRKHDYAPRVVPTSGSVKAFASPGDVLIWPNYEHQPSGRVFKLQESGHCGCPVKGGEKWSANLWFKLPTHFLDGAMHMVIRDFVGNNSEEFPPVGTSLELSDTLKRLDAALTSMETVEKRYDMRHIKLAADNERCLLEGELETAPGTALLGEAIELEHTAFADKGARRMYHFKVQFEYKERYGEDDVRIDGIAKAPPKNMVAQTGKRSSPATSRIARKPVEHADSQVKNGARMQTVNAMRSPAREGVTKLGSELSVQLHVGLAFNLQV